MEFTFDFKMFTTARVTADTEAEARRKLSAVADCLDIGVSTGDVNITEASWMDGEADLIEIDGEAT